MVCQVYFLGLSSFFLFHVGCCWAVGVGAIVAGPCCALGPLVVTEDFPTSVSVMVAVNEGDISGSSMKASVTAAALGVYVGAFFEVNGCFCGIFAKSLSISSRWDSKRSVSFNISTCVGICRIALIAEVLGLSLVSMVLAAGPPTTVVVARAGAGAGIFGGVDVAVRFRCGGGATSGRC